MNTAQSPIELWAGAECTINRVGDRYFDQMQRTGHDRRADDMGRLAALGARRVRLPVLWEHVSGRKTKTGSGFRLSDLRLERLESLGVEPIVGLVHHGSGPPHTSLCDPGFAPGLAAFATHVAARYPWVNMWTPVNEPLTTARFSALYGMWYPHQKQLSAFYAALVNQVIATRESMRAIRRINPRAQLLTTEDIGETFSTPELDAQRRYENERRWLSLDLMFGRVSASHALRGELERHGIAARLLDDLCAEPCPPDIVGVNYYVTSDRFLDCRLDRYRPATWGGNGRQVYADVEAVRARPEGIVGHQAVLEGAWARYGAPLALTEVHLACHREDQLRWLMEAWRGSLAARSRGVDVRALTVWSAFGAVGWNNLVTLPSGEYEPGAYDVRAIEPRPTALAGLAKSISRGQPSSPLASGAGWWRCAARLLHGDRAQAPAPPVRPSVLVVGADAASQRVAEICARRFVCLVAQDIASAPAALDAAAVDPWAVLIAPDPAGLAPPLRSGLETAWVEVRRRCAPGFKVLGLSSHLVFDGWSQQPYREHDAPSATDPSGLGWIEFERALARFAPQALIVRTGLVLDLERVDDAAMGLVGALPESPTASADDEWLSPVWMPDLIHAALDLLVDAEVGLWHLAPEEGCSALDLRQRLAPRVGAPFAPTARGVEPSARGPMRALASNRGWPLLDLETTLERALAVVERAPRRAAVA